MTRPDRIERDFREIGIPEVPLFGWYEQAHAINQLGLHTHKDSLEICYLVKGRQTFCVGENEYSLRGGDVFFTRPNEPHSSGAYPMEKSELYWLHILLPPSATTILGMEPEFSAPLIEALRTMPGRVFAGTPALHRGLSSIVRLTTPPESSLLRQRIVAEALCIFLQFIDCAHAARASVISEDIEETMQRIEKNIIAPWSVDDMAAIAGLSTSRFKARFKEEVGIPPREWVLRKKLDAAQDMLAAGRTVTDIALDLGFSSSQYFATVCKRFTGQSPTALQKALRKAHATPGS